MNTFKVVKMRRGTTLQHEIFVGVEGEITVDTDKKTVVVHDGFTAGGFPLKVEATTYDRLRYLTFRAAITQQGVSSLGFSAPANAPTPISIENSNGLISGAASFAYQTYQSVQDHFMLPSEWVEPLDVEIIWRSNLILGEVGWKIELCGVPLGERIDDATFNAPQFVFTIPGQVALDLTTSQISNLDTTGLEPGGECFFRLTRGTDSLVGDAELIALRFVIRVRGK